MRRRRFPLLPCLLFALGAAPLTAFAQRDNTPAPVPTPDPATINISASAPKVAPQPPRIVYGGAPLPLLRLDSAHYRDPADGEICVAPESLAPLGVIFMADDKAGKVTLSAGNGTVSVTVEGRTPPASVIGSRGVFVPAVAVIEGLGGKCQWDAATNTLYARAVLTGVERDGNNIKISATLPILPVVKRDETGKILMVDVPGAEIGALPKIIGLNDARIAQVRCGQFESDTARVVVQMKDASSLAILSDRPATEIALRPMTEKRPIAARTSKLATPATPALVRSVTFRRVSDSRAQFLISASSVISIRTALQGAKLTLDLLNATLAPDAAAALAGIKHPFLKAVELAAGDNVAASLALSLNRVVSYSVKPDAKGNILLDISLPRGAGGKLAGKTIVIDPGHGGKDAGAGGAGGAEEKDVALAIGLKLADSLRDAGANVVMTRADDFFIPVNERPRIANRINADFFISVHADSTDGSKAINGSTVYFHASDDDCRSLARCVISRVGQIGVMKSRGARTDYIRYPGTGYGVLRNAQMPAILCECGFMSNGGDVAKLRDPEKQQKIAEAIRAGLRDYIEGFAPLDNPTPSAESATSGDAAPPVDNSENPPAATDPD